MFLSTREIAKKWGVSEAWVSTLCKQGRISGAEKSGRSWIIPEEAKKPDDKRSLRKKPSTAKFRFIDLFAGIGGFHQAMRYLGGECLMAAEINQECVKTYNLNFKTIEKEIRGDVKKIDPTSIAPFDVLCAGFPCQPFSKAGAQQGFNDTTRGNLFYVIMDILDAHPEVKFVILENVRNLADKTENWGIITTELMKRNFYITEDPVILSPSDFGIPQIRERVYILGIRKDIRNERILTNGYIHKEDLALDKYYKKCKMGDAWSILEEEVDDSYIISPEHELMISAWDEFRIGTEIQILGFPIWLDSFGLGQDDDKTTFDAQGYDEMPSWKQKFLRQNRQFYHDHRSFIDEWVKKYDITAYMSYWFPYDPYTFVANMYPSTDYSDPSGIYSTDPQVAKALATMSDEEAKALIAGLYNTDDPAVVQEIFTEALNSANESSVIIPLNYRNEYAVFNSDVIESYTFNSIPNHVDVAAIHLK